MSQAADTIRSLAIKDLIPHREPMILLDELVDWGDNFAECLVKHETNNGYWDDDNRIPAYVGIEYMAQTIAVYTGILSTLAEQPIRIAYLLGTRKFDTNQCFMEANKPVHVRVEELFRNEDNIAVFDCLIHGDNLRMKAQLKGVQPPSSENPSRF